MGEDTGVAIGLAEGFHITFARARWASSPCCLPN
jgi:hypothetical protein